MPSASTLRQAHTAIAVGGTPEFNRQVKPERCPMPLATLDKIVDSLNAKPIPSLQTR